MIFNTSEGDVKKKNLKLKKELKCFSGFEDTNSRFSEEQQKFLTLDHTLGYLPSLCSVSVTF